MSQKKYASLSTLQAFLDNLKSTFSAISHKHTLSDITDYSAGSILPSTGVVTGVVKYDSKQFIPEEYRDVARDNIDATTLKEVYDVNKFITIEWNPEDYEGKDSFVLPSENTIYVKVSDEIYDFDLVRLAGVRLNTNDVFIGDKRYNLNGVNCYCTGGMTIVVTQAGECKLSYEDIEHIDDGIYGSAYVDVDTFTAPSAGIYTISYENMVVNAADGWTVDDIPNAVRFVLRNRYGMSLNTEDDNKFIVKVTNDGSITTTSEDGTVVEAATTSDLESKVPTTRTINGKPLSTDITLTPEDIGIETETDTTLKISGTAADAKVTGDAITNLNTLVGNTPVSEQIAAAVEEAFVEVYVQNNEPDDAPDGSIWVDLDADGAPAASGKNKSNVYVEDAGTTDISNIDFSKYAVGDVIVVTAS